MPLNYRARQSALKKNGKNLWYPMLVRDGGMVTLLQIAEKIAEKSSLTVGDILNVINGLIGELNDKLINGHSVRLDGLGSFIVTARAGGQGVEDPKDVHAGQINSLNIHFTPTAKKTATRGGYTYALLEGVEFQRWPGDPYAPNYRLSGPDKPAGGEEEKPGGGGSEEGGGGEGGSVDPNA
jgi:predicted histone-like DNA-binding protein